MVHPYVYTSSSGPPAARAGVPGEANCRVCHSDFSLNSAGGVLNVKVLDGGNEVQTYIPGKKYVVNVNITKAGSIKWGFESTVRKSSSTTTMAGTINAPSGDVQLVTLSARTYVSHTLSGSNKQTWEYEWTAPVAGTGEATIYTAANAANGNDQSSGDYIYTSQLKIAENTSASISEIPVIKSFNMFPNPANENLNISFALEKKEIVEINLIDISGKMVKKLFYGSKNIGEQTIKADVEDVAPGVYLLQLTIGNSSTFHRAVIQ
jgi:hypothetical protein